MRWLKPTLTSLYGLLGQEAPPAEPTAEEHTETIRQAMLGALRANGIQQRHAQIVRRTQYAENLRALWYLRSDMMVVLASECGEAAAQQKMAAITELFQGLLPEALRKSRPSRHR